MVISRPMRVAVASLMLKMRLSPAPLRMMLFGAMIVRSLEIVIGPEARVIVPATAN